MLYRYIRPQPLLAILTLLGLLLIGGPMTANDAEAATSGLQPVAYLPLTGKLMESGDPQPSGPPIIVAFSANPASIIVGGTSTLSWDVRNADTLTISPAVGVVTGSSVTDSPAQTTEYTLTATNEEGETTDTTTVTVEAAPPPPSGGGIFPNREVETASSSVKVDAQGGMHIAYVYFTSYSEHPKAIYRTCATDCDNEANWSVEVALGDLVDEVQLELTPAGKPRLLFVSSREEGGRNYNYAECNQNCTSQSGWSVGVATYKSGTEQFDIFDTDQPQRYFALDHLGRPRFVFQDRNYTVEPDLYGAYYAACDTNCTQAANWQRTRISYEKNEQFSFDYEIFDYPSLTFTAQGQPRLIANVFALNEDGSDAPDGLYYLSCDAGCNNLDNWQRLFLLPTGGGSYPSPGWDLALDTSGRPRVVLFAGDGDLREDLENRVLYIWCNNQCLASNTNWEFNTLGMERGDGVAPDLELDEQNRPRVAWIGSSGSVGYSYCNTACETETPQWTNAIVETQETLRAEFEPPLPTSCSTSLWNGLSTVLVLDGAGNPHIGYDIEVEAYCSGSFNEIWRMARFTFFPQP